MIIPIVIDKAEQRPWSFPAEYASVERLHLKTGDYALKNDHGFAIERKSIDDLVGTLSSGAERFDRELTRMLTFPERVIIVEGSWSNILNFEYEHPRVEPQYIRSELCRLTMEGVHIMFADCPHYAAYLAWGIIKARWDMIEHGLFTLPAPGTTNILTTALTEGAGEGAGSFCSCGRLLSPGLCPVCDNDE